MGKTPFHYRMEELFPYTLLIPVARLDDVTRFLNRPERRTPTGSSYSVSPNFDQPGHRWLYLSKTSAQRLQDYSPSLFDMYFQRRDKPEVVL